MEDRPIATSAFPATLRRQFTVAGMLSFMLAVGVYCSMLASLRPLLNRNYLDSERATFWPIYATVLTAWCVLWWLYRRWRLPQALRVHYAGPLIAVLLVGIGLCLGILFGLFSIAYSRTNSLSMVLRDAEDILKTAFVAMIYACGISTAVSLPAAAVMLVYLMLLPVSDPLCRTPRRAPSRQATQTQATSESQSDE
jgi:hypothetical protein